jgi:ketosteroid isomerase-like protein
MSVKTANESMAANKSWFEKNRADDAIIVLANGAMWLKTQSLAAIENRKATIEEFDLAADTELRICGDMAVQVGPMRVRVRDSQGKVTEQRYRGTVAYVRREGRWLELVDHTTAVQQ